MPKNPTLTSAILNTDPLMLHHDPPPMTVMLTATLPSQATIPTLDVSAPRSLRLRMGQNILGMNHIMNRQINSSQQLRIFLPWRWTFIFLREGNYGRSMKFIGNKRHVKKKHIDSTIIPVNKNKFLTSKKGSLSSPYPCVTLKLRHIKLAHWALRSPLRHRKADRQEENVTFGNRRAVGDEGLPKNWHLQCSSVP